MQKKYPKSHQPPCVVVFPSKGKKNHSFYSTIKSPVTHTFWYFRISISFPPSPPLESLSRKKENQPSASTFRFTGKATCCSWGCSPQTRQSTSQSQLEVAERRVMDGTQHKVLKKLLAQSQLKKLSKKKMHLSIYHADKLAKWGTTLYL